MWGSESPSAALLSIGGHYQLAYAEVVALKPVVRVTNWCHCQPES
jgi:hypothetical protein